MMATPSKVPKTVRFAIPERSGAKKNGGVGRQQQAVAHRVLDGTDASSEQDASQAGEKSGNSERRDGIAGDGHAGETGGFAIAADGVESPPELRLTEHDASADQYDQHPDRQQGNAGRTQTGDVFKRRRDAGEDAGTAGNPVADATDNRAQRQGGNERRHAETRNQCTAANANENTTRKGDKDRRQNAETETKQRDDNNGGPGGDEADGQIKFRRRHDKGSADGEHRQSRHLLADVEKI